MHVERDENRAKFWLNPVRLDTSGGFGRSEINRVESLVRENESMLLREWHAFFGR